MPGTKTQQDNDAVMLQKMGYAITDLEVKFRASSLEDRIAMRPSVEQLLNDYADYRMRLLKEGVITTDADLEEMKKIKKDIDSAAKKQELIKAIARTAAFIATKV